MDGRLTEERVERPGRVLDLGRVTGLGMASGVEFAGIEDVEPLLGAGQDQFTMGEVSTGTDPSAIATVALYGGPGEDRIDVLESMAPNELTVSGDSGDDFITLAGTTAGTDPQSFGTTIYGEDINVATLRQGTPDGAGASEQQKITIGKTSGYFSLQYRSIVGGFEFREETAPIKVAALCGICGGVSNLVRRTSSFAGLVSSRPSSAAKPTSVLGLAGCCRRYCPFRQSGILP